MEKKEVRSTRIIIDAFDESSEGCKSTVLPFLLGEFAKSPSAPQILITSREHANLEIFLRDYPTIKLNELNRKDIYEYVSDEISRYHSYHQSHDIVKRLVQKVVDRSHGVFLWVRLVAAELRKGKMIVGTLNDLEAEIDSLPDGLASYYDRILRMLDTSPGSETHRMFEWVLFTKRPQTLSEFCYAMAMGSTSSQRPNNLDALRSKMIPTELMEACIRQYSGGLLEAKLSGPYADADVDICSIRVGLTATDADADADVGAVHVGSNATDAADSQLTNNRASVQVIHQWVKDYLLKLRSKKTLATELTELTESTESTGPPATSHLFVPGAVHKNLAQTCISYLCFPDFTRVKTPFGQRSLGPWKYCSQYWQEHSSLSELSDTTPQLLDFGWPAKVNLELWWTGIAASARNVPRQRCRVHSWKNVHRLYHPLMTASRFGLLGDVRYWLRALVRSPSGQYPRSVPDGRIVVLRSLSDAAEGGHMDVLELLLESNEFIEGALLAVLFPGPYPYSKSGQAKITGRLLEWRLEENGHDEQYTLLLAWLLWIAQRDRREEIAELLVQRLNAPTSASDGRTALDRAMATSASDAAQMRVLLHCGANANLHVQRHYPGNPPEGHRTVHVLHAAIMDEDVRIVDVLLEYNADIHATDEAGNSALQLAIMLGKGDIVALLLTYGAAVHTPQGKYENAFDLARHVNLMIMEMLLEKHPEYKLRYKLRKTLAKDDCKCDPADECTCQDRIVPIEDPDA